MAKFSEQLMSAHVEFIEAQKMYFVASAPHEGRVSSPRGVDSFRVLGPARVAYVDLTYISERETLVPLAEAKGAESLLEYQRAHNAKSIDGLPTGLTQ